MNFDDTPEEAAFRAEARAWIDANAPTHLYPILSGSGFGTSADAGEIDMLAEVAVPQVLQVELHPLLQRKRLRAYCEARGILLQAYGHHHAELRVHMPLQAVATGSSPSAVGLAAMRWSLQVQRLQPPHALTSCP